MNRPMIFDTHAHYDDEAFDPDRDELLNSMEAGGVGTIVNVGASIEDLENLWRLWKSIRLFTAPWGFIRMTRIR